MLPVPAAAAAAVLPFPSVPSLALLAPQVALIVLAVPFAALAAEIGTFPNARK